MSLVDTIRAGQLSCRARGNCCARRVAVDAWTWPPAVVVRWSSEGEDDSRAPDTTKHPTPTTTTTTIPQALLEKSLFITNGDALEELDDDDGRGAGGCGGGGGGGGGADGNSNQNHDWAAAEDAEGGGHHGGDGAVGGLSELEVRFGACACRWSWVVLEIFLAVGALLLR